MTGKPYKPPCGAVNRKGMVLSDKEKVALKRHQVGFSELNESKQP
jgi:hypothetical protein